MQQQQSHVVFDVPVLPRRHAAASAQLEKILRGKVEQNETPRDIIANVISRLQPRAVREIIEKVHVDEQEHMVRNTIGTIAVDEKRAEVPHLQNDQRGDNVSGIGRDSEKAVFHRMQQRVVFPDQVDKDQIIDQLDVFDLFFHRP